MSSQIIMETLHELKETSVNAENLTFTPIHQITNRENQNNIPLENFRIFFDIFKFDDDKDETQPTNSKNKGNSTTTGTETLFLPESAKEKISQCSDKKKGRFSIKTYKFRGRKVNREESKTIHHSIHSYDNILRKIQIHYFTFLVNLANDVIKTFLGAENNIEFKQINYIEKINITVSNIESLKRKTIGEILSKDISIAYSSLSSNHNGQVLSLVKKKYPVLSKFFDQSFQKVLVSYYFNERREPNIITFDNKKITLSPKTKNFENLKEKNSTIKKNLTDIIKDVYFPKNIFFIEKEEYSFLNYT